MARLSNKTVRKRKICKDARDKRQKKKIGRKSEENEKANSSLLSIPEIADSNDSITLVSMEKINEELFGEMFSDFSITCRCGHS